jgi:hypothetical protein
MDSLIVSGEDITSSRFSTPYSSLLLNGPSQVLVAAYQEAPPRYGIVPKYIHYYINTLSLYVVHII